MNCRNLLLASAVGLSVLPLFAAPRTLQKSIEKHSGGKYPATWEAMNGVGYWAEAGTAEDKLEAGYGYVVPNKLTFSTPQASASAGTLVFPGDSLTIQSGGGMIFRHTGSTMDFGEGGILIQSKSGIINYSGSLGATKRANAQAYVRGRVEFDSDVETKIDHANNVNVGETFYGKFVLTEKTSIKFLGVGGWDDTIPAKAFDARGKRNSVELLGDTSEVCGSIDVRTNMYFVIGSGGLENVKAVKLNGNADRPELSASIRPSADMAATSITVKNLQFAGGSIETPVTAGGSKRIHVSGTLTIDQQVDVYISAAVTNCQTLTRYPILSAESTLDVGDFRFAGVYDNADSNDFSLQNPARLVVADDETTGKSTLYLEVTPIISCVLNSTSGNSQAEIYFCQLTNAASWSDGKLPHGNAHYICTQSYLRGPLRDEAGKSSGTYVFPGLSLTLGGTTQFFETYADFNCADLRLLSGSRLMLWNGVPRRLSGMITVNADNAAGSVNMIVYQSRVETLAADVHGQGTFAIGGNASSGSPMGTVVFAGNNSAFLGKFRFCTGVRTSAPILPDWSQQFNVYVSADRHLGGPLPEPVFDAITVEDYTKLLVTNDVEVAENRGLYVRLGAELCVSTNVTATFGYGVTVDGKLVKSGDGTLAIGGSFNALEGGNDVEVREGALKPLSSTCFDGAALSLVAGTRIVYDLANGADFMASGIRFTKPGSSFTVSGGKAKVDICSSTGVVQEETEVRLFTGTGAQCATFLDSVEIGTCSVGRRVPELSVVDNLDGSSSVVADIAKVGAILMFR